MSIMDCIIIGVGIRFRVWYLRNNFTEQKIMLTHTEMHMRVHTHTCLQVGQTILAQYVLETDQLQMDGMS